MPMHLPLPTAFAPLDAHRYLPPTAGTPYHPPTSFLDTLHYGAGTASTMFAAPVISPLRPMAATPSKNNDSIFVPAPARLVPKIGGGCSVGDGTTAKDDEVTSSEETKLVDNTNYLPFGAAYSLDREAVSESAAKFLFLAVKWAKSVPSFNHIPMRDQSLLVEETWAELFVITSAQYGLPIESECDQR